MTTQNQNKIKELETTLASVQNELEKLRQPNNIKYWKPVNGEEAYYIAGTRTPMSTCWENKLDKELIQVGDVFPTKKLAKQKLNHKLATQRLKEAIWDANDGCFLPINYDDDYKHIVTYDSRSDSFSITSNCYTAAAPKWYYIKSYDKALKVLSENEADFRIYLGVDKG